MKTVRIAFSNCTKDFKEIDFIAGLLSRVCNVEIVDFLDKPEFVENRHDQSVLSGVVYSHQADKGIKLLYQTCEIPHSGGQAVFTARKSDTEQRNSAQMLPWHLEIVRKSCVVPLRYLEMYYHRSRGGK